MPRFRIPVGAVRRAVVCLAVSLSCVAVAADPTPRFDQCQVIGTHNSYHIAPGPVIDALLRKRIGDQADSLAYTHRPLREQLEILGVRQLELDLYADPEGGRFATPLGPAAAAAAGLGAVPSHDPTGLLREPGFKILHIPDVDYLSRAPTFRSALEEIRDWSQAHPAHFPVFVMLELKEDAAGDGLTRPLPFDAAQLDALDAEIRSVIPERQRFEPDRLRGRHGTLREAVSGRGWPPVSEMLGRILFALDNEDAIRERYLAPSPSLAGRACFVSVPREHPAAAWMKRNDPEASFDEIGNLVREGFLVRTRADSPTGHARADDVRQRDRALASGAQFVSTDYPEPDPSLSPYRVGLSGGRVARANPVSGGMLPQDVDLEVLAADVAGVQNGLGMRAHDHRRLDEASSHYARALALEPPVAGSDGERERVRRCAPLLLRVVGDPFPLQDVAVILHPERPVMAFHLFWEDDIDFPEDNDPCDHEVVWIEYDPATDRPTRVTTYYHGRPLSRPLTPGEPPRVGVEWGKHGSVPLDPSGRPDPSPSQLVEHWRRLNGVGRRLPEHPLGRGWPLRFEGDRAAFLRFEVREPLDSRIGAVPVYRSRWPNAVLNQYVLRYNFRVKPGWPWEME